MEQLRSYIQPIEIMQKNGYILDPVKAQKLLLAKRSAAHGKYKCDFNLIGTY